jgi:hypothetical protein
LSPSDVWCNSNGYTMSVKLDDGSQTIPDYAKAIQNNRDLNNVIAKISILFEDRGFRLQKLSNTLSSINKIDAENSVIRTKTSGSKLAESPLDKIRRVAKADIILEVDWGINVTGPKRSITYNLTAVDAYTNEQVAGAEGTGQPSFSSEIPVLLEEAVINNMDSFIAQLQSYFDDIMTNGREVALDLAVPDNGSGVDFEKEYGDKELSEIIDDWMNDNTVSHRFSKVDGTENMIAYNHVRIPLYNEVGAPIAAEGFARNLKKYLARSPYGLPCKLIPRGLGRCLIVVGEK